MRVKTIADKLLKGEDTRSFSPTDKRIAHALTIAYMHEKGEIKALIEETKLATEARETKITQLMKAMAEALASKDIVRIAQSREAAFKFFAGADGTINKDEREQFQTSYIAVLAPNETDPVKKAAILKDAQEQWSKTGTEVFTSLASLKSDENKSIEFALLNRGRLDVDYNNELDPTACKAIADNPELIKKINAALKSPTVATEAVQLVNSSAPQAPSASGIPLAGSLQK